MDSIRQPSGVSQATGLKTKATNETTNDTDLTDFHRLPHEIVKESLLLWRRQKICV